MIRKLRRKFIIINMSIVGLVLAVVFGVLILSTARQQYISSQSALDIVLELRDDMGAAPRFTMPGEGKPPDEQRDRKGYSSAFSAVINEDGTLSIARMNITIPDDDVATAVKAALESGKQSGSLDELSLSYRIAQTPQGDTKIGFVDHSNDLNALRRLCIQGAVLFFACMVALFFINLYLAIWALRPVQQAWEQQRQFIADASHELKTPLTVILANMGLLLANPDDTIRDQRKWVDNTKEEGLRMKKLVDDLLFLAKSDADRDHKQRLPISLSDTVWSAVLPFESIAFEKGISLDVDVAPDLIFCADGTQLQQAVGILMDNACKYCGEGGTVSVRLEQVQSKTQLRVHNTGTPIPPQALPHLFERFYRAEFSRERSVGGYGVGLAILDTIVRGFGGRCTVESTAQAGTTFTIHFPTE